MKYLMNLIFKRKGYIRETERNSWCKDKMIECEKELIATLNDEQKELFQSFKHYFINHIEEINLEDFEYFAHCGMIIGLEHQEFVNRLLNDEL